MSERDCKHGQQARACNVCEFERELAEANERLTCLRENYKALQELCEGWRTRCKEAQRQLNEAIQFRDQSLNGYDLEAWCKACSEGNDE